MKEQIHQMLVNKDSSIKETMRVIDKGGLGIAFVVDKDERLFGVVTDGDIRRAILRGISIEKPIEEIANKNPILMKERVRENEILDLRSSEEVKRQMPLSGSLKVPVVDKDDRIKDIIFIYPDKVKISFLSKDKPRLKNEGIRKILIIGGAGYLGSVLCRKLLNKGYKVRVLDNLTYGDDGIRELYNHKNFEFQKGDIRNISEIIEAINGMDAIVHLAAIVGDPACGIDPRGTLEINYLATKNIIETCKYFQINRFIFASTCSVYGQNPSSGKKLTENSPLNPVSLYGEIKIKCEQSILEAVDENFSPIILRMATLYGYSPNMRFDLAVNLLTAKALFEKEIPVFGGSQWRPWLHLEDAAEAYIICLREPIERVRGEIFNVLSENHKIFDIGKTIHSICPEAALKISKKITDKRNYNVSFAKIFKTLNYQPRKKISDGVLEIKNLIKKGLVKNYKDSRYRTSLS